MKLLARDRKSVILNRVKTKAEPPITLNPRFLITAISESVQDLNVSHCASSVWDKLLSKCMMEGAAQHAAAAELLITESVHQLINTRLQVFILWCQTLFPPSMGSTLAGSTPLCLFCDRFHYWLF
ncbi:hypothetical protein XENORESO_007011 [Xenotaenia resolanae]|uniref:Uncharacterized protein n=1 Tax=Xenotaenia resolanae TaxID=208358 RepID=A0ABV0VW71_9TELE